MASSQSSEPGQESYYFAREGENDLPAALLAFVLTRSEDLRSMPRRQGILVWDAPLVAHWPFHAGQADPEENLMNQAVLLAALVVDVGAANREASPTEQTWQTLFRSWQAAHCPQTLWRR